MEHAIPLRRGKGPLQGLLGPLGGLRGGRPRLRLAVGALAALIVLGGGFLLFRGSSFVAVQQVQITGVSGADAGALEGALRAEARQMSTMDFSVGALEAAVARFHLVRSMKVSVGFPHRMRISVAEQLPVATLAAASGSVPVAADGVVLGGGVSAGAVPSIAVGALPRAGGVVSDARVREYLALLGAAPQQLLPLVARLYVGAQGLTVKMRNGLLVYFGDASRPHAKWDSLVAVLSSSSSAGATYVDVTLPERPAAGMPEGTSTASEAAQVSASDPTSAALAASLARAVAGEPPIEASPTGEAPAATESEAPEGEESPEVTTPEAAVSAGG